MSEYEHETMPIQQSADVTRRIPLGDTAGNLLPLLNLDFRSYEATRSGLTCWFAFCPGVA